MVQYSALYNVSDLDLLVIRIVHENARSELLQLKRFGMATHGDFLSFCSRGGIQKRERAVSLASHRVPAQELFSAVANDHAVAVRVKAHVVRIAGELHGLQKLKRGSVENLHRSVTPRGHDQAINGRVVECSLWPVQICNRVRLPAALQVDDLEGVIVRRRREEALDLHIDAAMIHASVDVGQGYAALEGQGRTLRGGRGLLGRRAPDRGCAHRDCNQWSGEGG